MCIRDRKGSKPTITIGKDTRISSDMLEAALMAGICSVGGDVMPLGTIPTPAVAYLTVLEQADAGIVISASHNPYEHNGIKVFNARGYKLSDESEARVEELILSGAPMDIKTHGEIGKRLHGMRQMKRDYIDHLISSIDCDLSGLRVLVDCANGAASATAPDLFDGLPLHADFIHREPDGVNINDGCGSTHLKSLSEGVVAGGYDLGIAFDGDADRCLCVDETGMEITGDHILFICGRHMKQTGELLGNTVVATVMSNLGLFRALDDLGIASAKTAVGDKYVYEYMTKNNCRLGGEQSGHIIFSKYASTGDGILTSLKVMEVMCAAKKTLHQLASDLTIYPQKLINVRVKDKKAAQADAKVQEAIRAAEEKLGDTGRVLVRESGTEPLVRVMVEAQDAALCARCCEEIAQTIRAQGWAL